jgi:hypothetical protein
LPNRGGKKKTGVVKGILRALLKNLYFNILMGNITKQHNLTGGMEKVTDIPAKLRTVAHQFCFK